MYTLEGLYSIADIANLDVELDRIEQALDLDPRAVKKAMGLTEQWDLDLYEQRLLAIELHVFEVGPQLDDRIRSSYWERYKREGDHLVLGGETSFAQPGWILRLGASGNKLNEAMSPGYFADMEAQSKVVAENLQGLVFNVAHEAVLATLGLCARQVLDTRKRA